MRHTIGTYISTTLILAGTGVAFALALAGEPRPLAPSTPLVVVCDAGSEQELAPRPGDYGRVYTLDCYQNDFLGPRVRVEVVD